MSGADFYIGWGREGFFPSVHEIAKFPEEAKPAEEKLNHWVKTIQSMYKTLLLFVFDNWMK